MFSETKGRKGCTGAQTSSHRRTKLHGTIHSEAYWNLPVPASDVLIDSTSWSMYTGPSKVQSWNITNIFNIFSFRCILQTKTQRMVQTGASHVTKALKLGFHATFINSWAFNKSLRNKVHNAEAAWSIRPVRLAGTQSLWIRSNL